MGQMYFPPKLALKMNIPLVFYVCASDDGIDYDNWWKHHEMIQTIGFELIKRAYYSLFVFR